MGLGGKPYTNVELHLASIDRMPLPDSSVDVVVSNCVINLAPDKAVVFREIARVLKPGGRLAVSDIALKKPLPAQIPIGLQFRSAGRPSFTTPVTIASVECHSSNGMATAA